VRRWLRARLRWLAVRQLRESERCLKEAARLKADGAGGSLAHELALLGGYIYLLRAELLGLSAVEAQHQRLMLGLFR
jgi:hypothetical protein